ncbi:hypothetical protein [Xanthocytophaga agilis]|uniref:Uncharacterized protein n=1 Tax=Xanthocytophaga agilis TaxID=3048010 RepID=A0AAE3UH94_9BACT|nr:hypothetical protein [Xanthocytophaga agilis]MDJ1505798.1 hypothetical protein [Xanthocytophaga agilis]
MLEYVKLLQAIRTDYQNLNKRFILRKIENTCIIAEYVTENLDKRYFHADGFVKFQLDPTKEEDGRLINLLKGQPIKRLTGKDREPVFEWINKQIDKYSIEEWLNP